MTNIPVEDRLAIQELTYLYGFYADTKDWHKVVDLFVDDCMIDETAIGLPLMHGKEAITKYYIGGAVDLMEYFIHYTTNHIITEYTGDYARVISYILGLGKFKSGSETKILAYMDDEQVKVGGQWRIKSRTLVPFTAPTGVDL